MATKENTLYYKDKSLKKLPTERWVRIPKSDDGLLISSMGRVRTPDGTILNQCLSNKYPAIKLKINGITKFVRTHRLLALSFLVDKLVYPKSVVNHINGIKTDNRVENIEVISQRENLNHAVTIGLRRNDHWLNKTNTPASKPIKMICRYTGVVKEYPSTRECCRQNPKFKHKTISQVLNGVRKSCYNHYFYFT